MDVTDILRDRVGEPPGLQRMFAISLALHTVLVAGFLFAPGQWLSPRQEAPKTVMTISLGGGNGGPSNGGLTSIGGRAIQAETPPDAPKRPEAVRAPAAATPAMTVPIPGKTPVKASPRPVVAQAPDQAKGRTPTRGPETREGSALAETGARGQGFGLSTSGGVGSGSTLDVQDFCCPDYLVTMVEKIRANWNPRADVPGMTIVKYTIQRDGTIVNAEIERPSGYTALDINSLRAVAGTRQLPALPSAFPNPTLTVHLNFQYTR